MGIGDWFRGIGRKIGGAFRGAWDGVKKVGSFVVRNINPVNWTKNLISLGQKADAMAKEGKSAGEILNAGVQGLGAEASKLGNLPVINATPLGLAARTLGGAVKAGQQYAAGDAFGALKTAVDTGKAAKGDIKKFV